MLNFAKKVEKSSKQSLIEVWKGLVLADWKRQSTSNNHFTSNLFIPVNWKYCSRFKFQSLLPVCWWKETVKVSHSLTAVKVPLYLGHSTWKAEPIPFLSLPYPSLIRKRHPFIAGLTERVFHSEAQPASNSQPYGNFLHHNQATLNYSTTAPLLTTGSKEKGVLNAVARWPQRLIWSAMFAYDPFTRFQVKLRSQRSAGIRG